MGAPRLATRFSSAGDMLARSAQRLKWSVMIAVVVAVALTPLAQACGNIHGSPNCGVLTIFALLFVVPALVVESWFFAAPLIG